MLGVTEQQQGAVAAKDCATVERVIQKVRITNLKHFATHCFWLWWHSFSACTDYSRIARLEATAATSE